MNLLMYQTEKKSLFCVRWVDEDLHFHEVFISLYEMEKMDATAMVNVIKDILLRLGLDKQSCMTNAMMLVAQ